jgi:hypothetical protein
MTHLEVWPARQDRPGKQTRETVARNSEISTVLINGLIGGIRVSGCLPGAHACNPSYLGGRAQEDHGSKPTPAREA